MSKNWIWTQFLVELLNLKIWKFECESCHLNLYNFMYNRDVDETVDDSVWTLQ